MVYDNEQNSITLDSLKNMDMIENKEQYKKEYNDFFNYAFRRYILAFPNRVYMNPTMLQKEWKMLQQK